MLIAGQQAQNHPDLLLRSGPDLREGKLAKLPTASTTRGASTKTVKNYYLRKHKKYFLKLIIWNKKYDVSLFI